LQLKNVRSIIKTFSNPICHFFSSDTFASKVAAIQDKYADASVGNVTGSNAVNVFLGIGIAWTMAAVYHAANGNKFEVPSGK
jgi:solute carrier family 8 (sodium/calcium exchanger)